VCFVLKDNTFVPVFGLFSEQTCQIEAFVPVFGRFSEQIFIERYEISRPKKAALNSYLSCGQRDKYLTSFDDFRTVYLFGLLINA